MNGEYLPWGNWGPCSKTCGEAVQSRSRECSLPRHGGEVCSGEDKAEIRPCDVTCPGRYMKSSVGFPMSKEKKPGNFVSESQH